MTGEALGKAGNTGVEIVVPPRRLATASPDATEPWAQRNLHIERIAEAATPVYEFLLTHIDVARHGLRRLLISGAVATVSWAGATRHEQTPGLVGHSSGVSLAHPGRRVFD